MKADFICAKFTFYVEDKMSTYDVFWEILAANEFKYRVSIHRNQKFQGFSYTNGKPSNSSSIALIKNHIENN